MDGLIEEVEEGNNVVEEGPLRLRFETMSAEPWFNGWFEGRQGDPTDHTIAGGSHEVWWRR